MIQNLFASIAIPASVIFVVSAAPIAFDIFVFIFLGLTQ